MKARHLSVLLTKCYCLSSYICVIYSPGSILEFLTFLQHLLDGGRYPAHSLSLAHVEEATVTLREVIFAFWVLGLLEHPDFGVTKMCYAIFNCESISGP